MATRLKSSTAKAATWNVYGTRHDLDQFHFHAPSEHLRSGGKHAALEAHLVHKSADGKLAVVGLLFQEGGEGLNVSPVWNNLAHTETPEQNDRR